VMVEGTDE